MRSLTKGAFDAQIDNTRGFVCLVVAGRGATYLTVAPTNEEIRDQEFRDLIATSRSEHPQRGLGRDWFDCQVRYSSEENKAPHRVVCEAWTERGVTSTLIALKFGAQWVPVVETRLADTVGGGPVVLDIQGGPGDGPFQVNRGVIDEPIARLRRYRTDDRLPDDIRQSPYYQLLERGYTVASIGYWGMNLRTLNAPDEFDLAARDVRMAVDYYRGSRRADLSLITVSLGNHLALAALGKDRIEKMNVLALVPVMDGLQHHLKRTLSAMAKVKTKSNEDDHLFGTWKFFNIYRHSGAGVKFDHSRMLRMNEFAPTYIGDADFPWKEVTPAQPCSKIVLGDKDPRTLAYLNSTKNLPDFVSVLKADHNLFEDEPGRSQTLFAEFADCLAKRRM